MRKVLLVYFLSLFSIINGQDSILKANFSYELDLNACEVLGYFTDRSTLDTCTNEMNEKCDSILSWRWYVAGDSSTFQNTVWLFKKRAYYPVTLIVESAKGLKDTLTKNILIDIHQPKFSISKTEICQGETLEITNLSIKAGPENIWRLQWDDKTESVTDQDTNFSHVYEDTGTFSLSMIHHARLMIGNNPTPCDFWYPDTAYGDAVITVKVNRKPKVDISGKYQVITQHLVAKYKAVVDNPSDNDVFSWKAEGGTLLSKGNTDTVSILWDQPSATSYVSVEVRDSSSDCSSTVSEPIHTAEITTRKKPIVSIFPNPAKNEVTVEGSHLTKVCLMDAAGRNLITTVVVTTETTKINLEGIKPGIVLMVLETVEGEILNEKLVIIE